jgi:hypothetical protein
MTLEYGPPSFGGGSPQERWNNIARVTLWIGLLLAAIAVYGIVQGDDLRSAVMTIIPGLLSLAMWRIACWRRDA